MRVAKNEIMKVLPFEIPVFSVRFQNEIKKWIEEKARQ